MINDSCIKGAFLVYNAISCLGRVSLMGHWHFTDAYADYRDTREILFGGSGILSKDGIKKPAFYAMEFMNRLYTDILAVSQNCIITKNEQGSIRILCHNLKRLNYHYYFSEEDSFQKMDTSDIIENRERLAVHIQIEHIKEGAYLVKHNQVNRQYGSVLDNWKALNQERNLTMNEMDYLKATSRGHMMIDRVMTRRGQLNLDVELKENEIQYIVINRILNL